MEPADASTVGRAGVVGAGTMGRGIARVFATAGIRVTLVDVDPEALEDARRWIRRDLARSVEKGRVDPEAAEAATARVETSSSLEALAEAPVVVEAASEEVGLKERIFEELAGLCPRETVLASNTSSISITRLAAHAPPAARVAGMHFMNPVPAMELVEVVRGLQTANPVVAFTGDLARRLGKTPVTVEDAPGFVSNRVLMPMINEAVYCLMEGVAEAEAIDRVMTLGMNHPMGPLALADLIGLDTCLAILRVLHRDLGDAKYRPCPLLRRYVDAGWLGRKAGRGFYEYDG